MASLLSKIGPFGTPVVETTAQWRAILRSPVTIAMFESQGHFLALLRSFSPLRQKRRLVIIACWLADIAPGLSSQKRRIYRRMYSVVDLVIVFSLNQRDILARELGIPIERMRVVPFGIDTREFEAVPVVESGIVLAVGRDNGRDWKSLLKAVSGTGWTVKVACRPSSLVGLTIPPEVEVLGYVDRSTYRTLLASANVVVIATENRAYPTGQSVMLEAMALGKACVVTWTDAMDDYVVDEVNCLTVAPHDVGGLRSSIERVLQDESLRRRLGSGGSDAVAETFNSVQMWRTIGGFITGLLS